jgi:hypothetical protein
MLRWNSRFTPLLISLALIAAAVLNARAGARIINFGW